MSKYTLKDLIDLNRYGKGYRKVDLNITEEEMVKSVFQAVKNLNGNEDLTTEEVLKIVNKMRGKI